MTDPNAVFSLPAAANEFTEGFTIGSILGGGQAGVLSAAQAMQGSPITSYAEAFRRFIGMKTESTATSELTRYQELERKYLEGTLGKEEEDELWRLERMRGKSDVQDNRVDRGIDDFGEMLEKDNKSDTILQSDIFIGKSLGAKSKNYEVIDPATGEHFRFVDGSKIQNAEVFAGYHVKKPLHEEVVEGLVGEFGGTPEKWQHSKGFGFLDCDGDAVLAEVHWFQEESVGKVKFKVKEWLE